MSDSNTRLPGTLVIDFAGEVNVLGVDDELTFGRGYSIPSRSVPL